MENNELTLENNVTLDKIYEFQKILLKQPQIECKLTHRYINGIYSREIFMPAGTVLTSKIHKKENISIISQGVVIDVTENDNMRRIEAPHTMIVSAGTKRALYIEEDTIWTTFHYNPDNLTDLKDLEDMIIEYEDDILKLEEEKKVTE